MKARAGMYRTPHDPGGFPFGYNWKATGTGLLLLVGFNFLATQYIAAQFRYQPALGTPLVRLSCAAVYQPFAWCVWGFQNCTSRDNRVRTPLFEGEMIVLGGCIGVLCCRESPSTTPFRKCRGSAWFGSSGRAG